jgi:hypothetical protein
MQHAYIMPPSSRFTVALARFHASSLDIFTAPVPLLNAYVWLSLVETCSGYTRAVMQVRPSSAKLSMIE